jgi:hypothetical protein
MEKKSQNILLLALAGFGIYYYLKNKNVSASIIPPTTGELPSPIENIKTPVEPVYDQPIYEERDPIYQEQIYKSPVDNVTLPAQPIYDQAEPTPTNNEFGGSVTDFANSQNWLGILNLGDEPIEYDFEQKRR